MAPHAALVETLFAEMKGRIKEDEAGVPQKDGDWLYWWAFKPGGQYRIWYRRPVAGGADAADPRRAGRGRGQGLFPARRARGQPRRPAARLGGGRQRRRTLHAAHPRSRHRRGHRDRHRGRPTAPVAWTRGLRRARLHRGQRQLADLPRAAPPPRQRSRDRRRRSTRRPTTSASTSALGRTQDRAVDRHRRPATMRPARSASSPPPIPRRRRSSSAARQAERQYSVDCAHGKLWILTNDDHVNFRLAEARSGRARASGRR